MTTFNLTCEAVEATLPDYLDGTLEAWVRDSIDEHIAGCARCATLVQDLRNNAREAAALPSMLPERDVWTNVAARIGAPGVNAGPAAESAPLTPAPERVVFSSDAFLPISEAAPVSEEPPAVTS